MLITIRKYFRACEATIVYSAATRCSSIDGDRTQKRTATEDPAVLQLSKEQKTANKTTIVCFGCENAGHVSKNCPHRTSSDFNPSPS